jgi:hypothetical protein
MRVGRIVPTSRSEPRSGWPREIWNRTANSAFYQLRPFPGFLGVEMTDQREGLVAVSQRRDLWLVQVPGENFLFGLEPEIEIGGTLGRKNPGQLIGAARDFQLQVDEVVALDPGRGRKCFVQKEHVLRNDRCGMAGFRVLITGA